MESNKQNLRSQLKPAWLCFTKIYQTAAIKLNRVEGKLVTSASKEGRKLFELYNQKVVYKLPKEAGGITIGTCTEFCQSE